MPVSPRLSRLAPHLLPTDQEIEGEESREGQEGLQHLDVEAKTQNQPAQE